MLVCISKEVSRVRSVQAVLKCVLPPNVDQTDVPQQLLEASEACRQEDRGAPSECERGRFAPRRRDARTQVAHYLPDPPPAHERESLHFCKIADQSRLTNLARAGGHSVPREFCLGEFLD